MIEASTNRRYWALPDDHPIFPGHFPDQPIVPGALLLDWVVQAVAQRLSRQASQLRIDSAKFLHPVGPNDRVEIILSEGSGNWRFTLKTDAQTIANGIVSLVP